MISAVNGVQRAGEVEWRCGLAECHAYAAMPAHAGDLDHAALRRKARALRRGVQAVGHRRGGRLADRAALLADQKNHRRVARMIVDAGEERVAALDAMHEALRGEKIERAIDRDWCRTRPARRDRVDDLVGADRLVACGEHFQHVPAHRRQTLAALRTQRLGVLQRIRRAAAVVMVGGGKNGGHERLSTRFRPSLAHS